MFGNGILLLLFCGYGLNVIAAQTSFADGVQFFKNKEYVKAKSVFEYTLKQSDDPAETYYYIGLIALRFEKNFDAAIENFEKAVEGNQNKSEYQFQLGNAYGSKARNSNFVSQMFLAPKVKNAFKKAVELDPAFIEGRWGLMQYYLLAPGVAGGSVDKAKEQAEAILNLDRYQGCMAYVAVYEYEKKIDKVEQYCQKAISANPQKWEPYHRLGYVYLSQKRYDESIAQFSKMVECNPEDPNSYDSLGDGYWADNKVDEALANYAKAVSINPSFSPSVFNLAQCYEKKNKKDEALQQYKNFLALVKKGAQADKARARIRDLEDK